MSDVEHKPEAKSSNMVSKALAAFTREVAGIRTAATRAAGEVLARWRGPQRFVEPEPAHECARLAAIDGEIALIAAHLMQQGSALRSLRGRAEGIGTFTGPRSEGQRGVEYDASVDHDRSKRTMCAIALGVQAGTCMSAGNFDSDEAIHLAAIVAAAARIRWLMKTATFVSELNAPKYQRPRWQ